MFNYEVEGHPSYFAGLLGVHNCAIALSDSPDAYTVTAVRLAESSNGTLPAWQQVHKLGEWAEPHASGQRIQLDRVMGNTMVRNFHARVIRRDVPLDEIHLTDQGGHALGWMTDLRWGSVGQGLPGAPEPDGNGPVLYGKFRYNRLGVEQLSDERYRYLSPQYHTDYLDKESGRHYGPAIVAVACTNNPFLRQRSIQGEEAPPVAVLSDGLMRPAQEQGMSGTNGTTPEPRVIAASNGTTTLTQLTPAVDAVALNDRVIQLEELYKREKAGRHTDKVKALFDREIHAANALEPRFRRLIEPVMLLSDPENTGSISLSDKPDEQNLNIYQLMELLIAELPRIPTGRVTLSDDRRPGSEPAELTGQAYIDAQLAEGKKRAAPFRNTPAATAPVVGVEA